MGETNIETAGAVTDLAGAAVASSSFWQSYGWTLFWVCVIGAAFAVLWYKGQLVRFATYVRLTREELRKCSWPSWDELKGSTVVIAISILLLGGFTVGVDFVLTRVLLLLT
ncbi:MAG: preprotein translocase subunit SecE [Verrucomicrobia bacterium]|jgi:preprotein translocase subunit SecE|nr:preprotein translocase subunit SecE [Verrucomicrobiota bacterium]